MRESDSVPKTATTKREMKVRIPKNARLAQFLMGRTGRLLIFGFGVFVILAMGVFTYFYQKYSKIIDEKLRAGVIANTAKIYAAPESGAVGDAGSADEIAAELRRSGYSDSSDNQIGSYRLHQNSIEIFPGKQSYFDQEAGLIKF